MTKKIKKWTYHVSHTYQENDNVINLTTQLYQIGVYAILTINGQFEQYNFPPSALVTIEKKLKKRAETTNVEIKWGREITVVLDKDGFYKELIE